MAGLPLTNDQSLALLRAKAESDGDSFRVKIFRKASPSNLPEHVCTLDEASLIHMATPEGWLPKFAGGGPLYMFTVYHSSDSVLPIGQNLQFRIDGKPIPANELNLRMVSEPNWQGPRRLVYPDPADIQAGPTSFISSSSFSPSLSPLGATAPQSSVPTGGQTTMAGSSYGQDSTWQLRAQMESEREALREEKRRFERENERRENEQRLKDLEQRFLLASAEKPRGSSGIEAILAVLAPVMSEMVKGQNDTKILMMKQQQEMAASQQEMMKHAMTRPQIDPIMEKFLEKIEKLSDRRSEDGPSSKMMNSMIENMGSIMKFTQDSVQMMAENGLGGPKADPPGLQIVKELVRGLHEVGKSFQPNLKMLPKGPQPQVRQAAPTSTPPRAAQGAVLQPQQATPVAATEVDGRLPPSSVDRIEAMIRGQIDPAVVASAFVAAIDDPILADELQEVGGNPIALFQARLGDWVTQDAARMGYINQLVGELQAQLDAAGFLVRENGDIVEVEDSEDMEEAVA